MNVSLTKQPSAYLPMAMSLAAFALALSHVLFGVVHEADEGTSSSSGAITHGWTGTCGVLLRIEMVTKVSRRGAARACAAIRSGPRRMCPRLLVQAVMDGRTGRRSLLEKSGTGSKMHGKSGVEERAELNRACDFPAEKR
jgi:hypothetical protein